MANGAAALSAGSPGVLGTEWVSSGFESWLHLETKNSFPLFWRGQDHPAAAELRMAETRISEMTAGFGVLYYLGRD